MQHNVHYNQFNSARYLDELSVTPDDWEDDVLPHLPARHPGDALENKDLLMNCRTCRISACVVSSKNVLTAGARSPRLSRPQAQAARVAVGREVRGVYGNVGELLVHDALEEVRVRGSLPPRVHHAGVEIARSLPVGGEVAEKRRLQQGAATTMLAPPPGHIVRAPHLDVKHAGRS